MEFCRWSLGLTGGGGTFSSLSLSGTRMIGVRADGPSGDGGKRIRRTAPRLDDDVVAAATASLTASVGRSLTLEGARVLRLAIVGYSKSVLRKF